MFVYIDESGTPHPHDAHLRPVNLAVCLKREDVRRVTQSLHCLMLDFERAADGIRIRRAEREGKATQFLTPRALLNFPAKREYAESVIDLMRNLDMTLFAIVMERPDQPIYHGSHKLQRHHWWILERIQGWMEQRYPDRLAAIIFDGRDRQENVRLDKCFGRFLFGHAEGRAMTHIIPNVLFVDSELTPGIKLADFCAYIVRVYYENNLNSTQVRGDPYLSIINRYYGVVASKTFNWHAPATVLRVVEVGS